MSRTVSSLARSQEPYWVSVLFALLAVLLALGPLRFQSPVVVPTPVPASVTDPTPVRQPAVTPVYELGPFTYRCSECHRDIPSLYAAGGDLTQHADIHLAHGMNTRCLNCHHPTNREAFVDDFGEEIPWDQAPVLCGKCHGPVYRDWQHGSHGRINGYWDTTRGEQVRLKCIACHDPHRPPFAPLASAPPPHTLRMTPEHGVVHTGVRNPLRITEDEVTSKREAVGNERAVAEEGADADEGAE